MRRLIAAAAAALLAGAGLASPARADAPHYGVVVLHVADARGHAVPDACVTGRPPTDLENSYDPAAPSTVTGDDGAASLLALPGTYAIEVKPCGTTPTGLVSDRYVGGDDRITTAEQVTVTADGAQDVGTVVLPAAGSFSGVVTKTAGGGDGEACVQVVTSVSGPGEYDQSWLPVHADADGNYTYPGLYPRPQIVGFESCSQSTPQTWWRDASSPTLATPVPVTSGEDTGGIDAVVQESGSVPVTVRDADGVQQLHDICIRFRADIGNGGTEGPLYGTGPSSLFSLAPGSYTANAYVCDGGVGQLPDLMTSAAQQITVTAGGQTDDVVFTMLPAASLTGVVRDGSGNPLAGMCVTAIGSIGSAKTAADGSYDLYPFDGGAAVVKVTDCGTSRFAATWWPHTVFRSQAGTVSVPAGQVTSGVDVVLDAPGATIAGTVTDSSGAPLYGICPELDPGPDAWHCDSFDNGRYTISDVPALQGQTLHADVDLASDDVRPVTVDGVATSAGEVTTVNLVLPIAGTITGSVIDQRGLPILGVRSRAECGPDGQVQSFDGDVTGSLGRYTITGLPAGLCRVTFDDAGNQLPFSGSYGYPLPALDVPVTAGGTTALPVQLVVTKQPPSAPIDLTSTPGDGSALLSWSPPASDGYDGIASYVVTDAGGDVLASTPGAATSLTVSHLSNGRQYALAVTAENEKGKGPASLPVTVTPVAAAVSATASPTIPTASTVPTVPTASIIPTASTVPTASVTPPSPTSRPVPVGSPAPAVLPTVGSSPRPSLHPVSPAPATLRPLPVATGMPTGASPSPRPISTETPMPAAKAAAPKPRLTLRVRRRGHPARLTISDAAGSFGRVIAVQGYRRHTWTTLEIWHEQNTGCFSEPVTLRLPAGTADLRLVVLLHTRVVAATRGLRAA